jgi:predicted amidophosphoribosyltransferase
MSHQAQGGVGPVSGRCEYCGMRAPDEDGRCSHCGAPRPQQPAEATPPTGYAAKVRARYEERHRAAVARYEERQRKSG